MSSANLKKIIANPLVFPIYAPALLLAFSRGLLIPVLPLFARELGASYGLIGAMLASQELGTLAADLPAGVVVRRLGRKRAMLLGLGTQVSATSLLFWAPSVYAAMALLFLAGSGMSLFAIARHQYLAEVVKQAGRGRAIATFGGVNRIGVFLGPAVGGALGALAGLRAPFLLFGVVGVIALILVLIFIQRTHAEIAPGAHNLGLVSTLKSHYRVLAAAGTAQLFMQTIRAGRNLIIPLIGADMLGLDVGQIGLVLSIGAAIDMSLFYPAGWLMDRYGRRYAIVPSCLIMGFGMALLPFTGGFSGLLVAVCVIGFGNGIGSGTMMTLGADLAPQDTRAEFLGAWRFIGDGGASLGPVIVGGVADIFVLPVAALFMSASGGIAGLIFARFVPEPLKRGGENPAVGEKEANRGTGASDPVINADVAD